jgi:hypothetical protein
MRTITTNYVTIPGTDIEIETSFLPDSESDILVNTTESGVIHVGWLVHDATGDTDDPIMDDEGVTFVDFSHRGAGGEVGRDEYLASTPDDVIVFLVDKYEHGGVHYSIANTANYPDRQWDVAGSCGVLWIPADVPDPRAYAVGVLDTYNAWCNGEAYGLVTCTVAPDGTVSEESEVWGYIGHEYATESLKWDVGLVGPNDL